MGKAGSSQIQDLCDTIQTRRDAATAGFEFLSSAASRAPKLHFY